MVYKNIQIEHEKQITKKNTHMHSPFSGLQATTMAICGVLSISNPDALHSPPCCRRHCASYRGLAAPYPDYVSTCCRLVCLCV